MACYDPRDHVSLECSACGAELSYAERREAHATDGRCFACEDARLASLEATARVLRMLAEARVARHVARAFGGERSAS